MATSAPGPTTFTYPLSISGGDDYLSIRIVEYIPAFARGDASSGSFDFLEAGQIVTDPDKNNKISGKDTTRIFLPMPQDIKDSNSASWASGGINPFISQAVRGSLDDNLLTNLTNIVGNPAYALGQAFEASTNAQKMAIGMQKAIAQTIGPEAAAGILQRATGQVINENVELLYTGVTLRPPFQFSFSLSPRSSKESDQVRGILRALKKNMCPSKAVENSANGLLISPPKIFLLDYFRGQNPHPFLNKFKPCALINMGIDYTKSNIYAVYEDGTPVDMQMTLTFQELSPIYSEDYDSNQSGVGY